MHNDSVAILINSQNYAAYSISPRKENIRRIGESAKLMMEVGLITLTAFISPFREDREVVRKLMPHGDFMEIYCKASLVTCELRYVKRVYKMARAGEIKNYTGIDSPYEEPLAPELVIDTEQNDLDGSVERVLSLLRRQGVLQ